MISKKLFFILLILGCGFLARGLFFYGIIKTSGPMGFSAPQNEDSKEYLLLSKNLLTGHFSRDAGPTYTPESFRTPGYPLFLTVATAFGRSLSLAVIIQNLLFLGFIYFFFLVLESKLGPWPSAAACAILAIDPTIIYWNNQLTSETVFTILLSLSVFFLFKFLDETRYRLMIWSMFFLIASIYVRPISMYLPVFYLLILLAHLIFKRFNFKKCLVASVIVILFWQGGLLPWQWRNQHHFDRRIFSTANSIGFGKYLTAMKIARGDTSPDILPPDYLTNMGEIRKKQLLNYIKAYPWLFIKIHLASFVPFFMGDGYANSLSAVFPDLKNNIAITDWLGNPKQLFIYLKNSFTRGDWIFVAGKVMWAAISLVAIIGLAHWLFRDKKYWLWPLSLTLIIYYFVLASGIGSYSRFRFPVNPLILILFAFGLSFVWSIYAHFTRRSNSQ